MNLIELRVYFSQLKHDQVFVWTSRIVLISILLCLVLLVILWHKLPGQIPLFYSLPWGEEQLSDPLNLFFLLFAGAFMYTLNTLVSALLRPKWPFFASILLCGGMLATILAIYTVTRIVLLITL